MKITKGGARFALPQKDCTYCQFAGKVDEETMICQKYGIVPAAHRCRKFRYDPLKRVPSRPHSGGLEKFNKNDFSL